ncbi:MAG: flagellar motor switch protein FliM [Clostridiales bacterium]|nr:flagellar motor switch protein FliM [Clostridiales bacterium]
MPDVLSQKQIDELLNSLAIEQSEEGPSAPVKTTGKKVKDYNFKTPKKLTKEQQKMILGIHENFARHLASYFSGILRTYCQISVASVEELPYYEYNNSLPDTVMIGAVDVKPIEGSMLVDISNTVTFALIARMLGGNGNALNPDREFTEIEISLMTRIFNQITSFTKDAWSEFIHVDVEMKQLETNARLVQAMPMEEVVIIVMMDVELLSVKGTISFCIPCINLEGIIDQLSKSQRFLKRQIESTQEGNLKEAMFSQIKGSELELRGIFGETKLTIHDIIHLQVGDVIKFDQSIDSDIKIDIGKQTWFYGVPGIRRNKKVIKVKKIQ